MNEYWLLNFFLREGGVPARKGKSQGQGHKPKSAHAWAQSRLFTSTTQFPVSPSPRHPIFFDTPTPEKDGWNIFRLWDMQHALRDSQLLMVEVQASDSPYHFLFEGPPKPETLFVLKEGSHFQGIKDPIIFFGKYCDFDRYLKKSPFVQL